MQSSSFSSFGFADDDESRLLSESPLSHQSSLSNASLSRTGHRGDDLSLSELEISLPDGQEGGSKRRRKFSLFAQPAEEESLEQEEEEVDGGGMDQTMTQEDIENARRLAAKTREEKLQHDLFILKKLNSTFDVYKAALRETRSATDHVAEQLKHTNALLNRYTNILSKSEKVTRLILDERWEGSEADEEILKREVEAELEKQRREEEERRRAAEEERERQEREERERQEREERERLSREKAESSKAVSRGSGVRGVRGTRASMRGMRGAATSSVSRGASTAARGTPTAPGSGGKIPIRRPGSSASGVPVRASSRGGIPRKVP